MPALACCVNAPPSSLPVTEPFPGVVRNRWSPAHSAGVYRINGWGTPYFYVNSSGNVAICPHGTSTMDHQEIDLLKVVKKVSDLKSDGGLNLPLPVIIRFPDVLKNRLESIQIAFNTAIEAQNYGSSYQGVYPVKCNQDRFVVEDIVRFGLPFGFGLEAGSKPELLLAMACLCKGSSEALLICNGFKDEEYISLAIMARKLSLNTVIVLEQEEELDSVFNMSRKLGVLPVVGVRAKLRTKHSGHFGSTSGQNGKFGLTTTQILRVVKKLKNFGMLDCLQLLHFHIGSQIPSTTLLVDVVAEAAQIYTELLRLGASMKVIDIGGGLGIDYNGSKSSDSDFSVSYTLDEYAAAVVHTIKHVCDTKSVKHPIICSESGRAIVSHHSVLIFEGVSSSKSSARSDYYDPSSFDVQKFVERLPEDAHYDYHNLSLSATKGDHESCLVYANQLKQRCAESFKSGTLDMEQLAGVDGLCDLVSKTIDSADSVTTYNINLSVFTSIPDYWGIGQLFPIMPIHRLQERPTVNGVLSDLTCDSDGKVNRFIGGGAALPLHEPEGETGFKYYLGMFLGGAYEEALGGVHNLFGAPSTVWVCQTDGPHGFAITRAVPGQSCSDVLRVMRYEPEVMFDTLKDRIEECHVDEDVGLMAGGIAECFNNMPYLTSGTQMSDYYIPDEDDDEDRWSFVSA
ncbi:arginine decarboxylase-like [Bidens hawaiensis]|uniref:arginine decarboxylase-like n=1 Tax=Bidens hawaiensis TaxID=980011 RepID=UPI004049FA2C